jgi:hypothetical protein
MLAILQTQLYLENVDNAMAPVPPVAQLPQHVLPVPKAIISTSQTQPVSSNVQLAFTKSQKIEHAKHVLLTV